ncbi:MAG: FCD domain-containing protein, partial [Planctomycetota bacterium]
TSGNPDLLAIWLPIVSRMMLHYGRHLSLMDSHREHAAIVDAIRAGDEEAALSALLANIQ